MAQRARVIDGADRDVERDMRTECRPGAVGDARARGPVGIAAEGPGRLAARALALAAPGSEANRDLPVRPTSHLVSADYSESIIASSQIVSGSGGYRYNTFLTLGDQEVPDRAGCGAS